MPKEIRQGCRLGCLTVLTKFVCDLSSELWMVFGTSVMDK